MKSYLDGLFAEILSFKYSLHYKGMAIRILLLVLLCNQFKEGTNIKAQGSVSGDRISTALPKETAD